MSRGLTIKGGATAAESTLKTKMDQPPEVSLSPKKRVSLVGDTLRLDREPQGIEESVQLMKELLSCLQSGYFTVADDEKDLKIGAKDVSIVSILQNVVRGLQTETDHPKSLKSEVIEHVSQISIDHGRNDNEKLHHRHQSLGNPSAFKSLAEELQDVKVLTHDIGTQTEPITPEVIVQKVVETVEVLVPTIVETPIVTLNQDQILGLNISPAPNKVAQPTTQPPTPVQTPIPRLEETKLEIPASIRTISFSTSRTIPALKPAPIQRKESQSITTQTDANRPITPKRILLEVTQFSHPLSLTQPSAKKVSEPKLQVSVEVQTVPIKQEPPIIAQHQPSRLPAMIPLEISYLRTITVQNFFKPEEQKLPEDMPKMILELMLAVKRLESKVSEKKDAPVVEQPQEYSSHTPVRPDTSKPAISGFSESRLATHDTQTIQQPQLRVTLLPSLNRNGDPPKAPAPVRRESEAPIREVPPAKAPSPTLHLESLFETLLNEVLLKKQHFSVTGSLDHYVSDERDKIKAIMDSLPMINDMIERNLKRGLNSCQSLFETNPEEQSRVVKRDSSKDLVKQSFMSTAMMDLQYTRQNSREPIGTPNKEKATLKEELASIFWAITKQITSECGHFHLLLSMILRRDYIFSREREDLKRIINDATMSMTSMVNYLEFQKEKIFKKSVFSQLEHKKTNSIPPENVEELRVFLATIKEYGVRRTRLGRDAIEILDKKYLKTPK